MENSLSEGGKTYRYYRVMCKDKDGKVRFSAMDMISSGKTGQTSATGTAGVVLCFLSAIVIIALLIMYFIRPNEAGNVLAFMDKITVVLGIGAALLGTRKISGALAGRTTANIVDLVENTVHDMDGDQRRWRKSKRNSSYHDYSDDCGEDEDCGMMQANEYEN